MNKIMEKIDVKKFKCILIFTLIFMVIAHGYCYTNLNFSHDSMRTFFWNSYDTIEIGRYILPLLLILRGKYYPPLLIGILTYIVLVLIIYLLVDFFKIKQKGNIILISGIFSTASTLTLLNATYINFSDMYIFACLLMTLAAWLWKNYEKGYLYAIIPAFISLGIYQSYIGFFIGMVMLISIKDLIDNKNYKEILSKGLKSLVTVFTSLVLYAVSSKVVPIMLGMHLSNSYNSVGGGIDYFKNGGIIGIVEIIKTTYFNVAKYIIKPSTYYVILISILNVILIFIGVIYIILFLKDKKIKNSNKILLIILLILLPFGINIATFLGRGAGHQLMIYSFFLLYILPIIIVENGYLEKYFSNKNLVKNLSKFKNISLVIIIVSGIIYSNQCYLKKNLEFDATLTTMNRIVDRIEQTEGYEVGKTKVAIIGNLDDSIISLKRKELDYDSVGLWWNFSITYYETYKQYFENYLGYPINIIDMKQMKKIAEKEEVKEMELFPSYESIKFVDDVLVVKIAEMED